MSELNYIRRKYSFKGEYIASETYDPLRFIESPSVADGPFWLNSSQQLSFMPALKKQPLKATYVVEQLIKDGNFGLEAFSDAGSLVNWTVAAPIRKKTISADKDNYGILLGMPQASLAEAGYIESAPVVMTYGYNTGLRLSLGVQVAIPLIANLLTPPQIYMRVKLGNHYLNSSGIWTLTESHVIISVAESKALTFSIDTDYIPQAGGTLQVRLYELISSSTSERPERDFTVDFLTVDLLENGEDMRTSLSLTAVNEARCTLVGDEIELTSADVPDLANARLAYPYGVIVANDITRKWYRLGKIEAKSIQEILLDQIMAFSSVPRQRLNGTVRSREMQMSFILQDGNNLPRLFMVGSIGYNTARSEFEIELLELDATLPATPDEEEGERFYEDWTPRRMQNMVLRRLERETELESASRFLENKQPRLNEDFTLRKIETQ
jgi:propanediol utilization protein